MNAKKNSDVTTMAKNQNRPTFISLKFNFSFVKKFITLDLHMKATIDDLKPTFANLLNVSLFSKKLIYFFKQKPLEVGKTMQELIDDKEIEVSSKANDPIILDVNQEEEGA